MAREYARTPRGSRATGRKPRNYGDVITVIGALTAAGLQAVMTVRGGTSKDVFLATVQQVLLPLLQPGDRVVLDNLAAHKDPRVKLLVEQAGAKLYFLPPYSPDLNPIELAWAWVKARLKTAAASTEQAVNDAIAAVMRQVSPRLATGWIAHCGFRGQAGRSA